MPTMGGKVKNKNGESRDTGTPSVASLEEQLDKARVVLDSRQKQMHALHTNWRAQLQRISVMVTVLVLHRLKTPLSICYQDTREWNESVEKSTSIDGRRLFTHGDTFYFMISNSVMEILEFCCCLCLIKLMYRPMDGNDFSSMCFRFGTAVVPFIIWSYYSNPTVGCLRKLEKNNTTMDENNDTTQHNDDIRRPFPVMLIFFAVGVASLFFMKSQHISQKENIETIEKLRTNLALNTKNNNKKKTK